MIDNIIKNTIKEFCLEFLQSPYICYTEHGLHAFFYHKLYSRIPEDKKYIQLEKESICIIQKEYPTASNLGKSKRQHWDIAVIESPPKNFLDKHLPYDYLSLNSVIEFGMNNNRDHLREDIRRLSHPDSNVTNKYIIQLYRISEPKFSNRDLSPKSKKILKLNDVKNLVKGRNVEIYFGIVNSTQKQENGLWQINNKDIIKIG